MTFAGNCTEGPRITIAAAGAGYVPTWVEMENETVRESRGHRVVNNSEPVRAPDPLRQQLTILPAGNRVSGAHLSALPGACSAHVELPVPPRGTSGFGGESSEESIR